MFVNSYQKKYIKIWRASPEEKHRSCALLKYLTVQSEPVLPLSLPPPEKKWFQLKLARVYLGMRVELIHVAGTAVFVRSAFLHGSYESTPQGGRWAFCLHPKIWINLNAMYASLEQSGLPPSSHAFTNRKWDERILSNRNHHKLLYLRSQTQRILSSSPLCVRLHVTCSLTSGRQN